MLCRGKTQCRAHAVAVHDLETFITSARGLWCEAQNARDGMRDMLAVRRVAAQKNLQLGCVLALLIQNDPVERQVMLDFKMIKHLQFRRAALVVPIEAG